MSELRHDPVQKRWVIIAKERGQRPIQFKEKEEEKVVSSKSCPFCEGNESKTPPEIFAIRDPGTKPNTPGWSLRVIPNKYPALAIEGELGRRGLGIYDMMNGIGAHEVIIETKQHNLHMGDMPLEHLKLILQVYRDRIADLYRDKRFRYAMIFKNYGAAAGASLPHPHTQLIATPITPRTIAAELESSKEHFMSKERCLFCDIINQEVALRERIIYQNRNFIAMAPFASRFPFETWILPKCHGSHFEDIEKKQVKDLAGILRRVLFRLEKTLPGVAYNYIIHTAPFKEGFLEHYHWHIEIIPRLTKVAGFEWGTGCYINPMAPEDACSYLRKVNVEELEVV